MKHLSLRLVVCTLLMGFAASGGLGQYKDMFQAGKTQEQAGKHAESRKSFEEALRLATNDVEKADAQIAIALTYDAEQNWTTARAELTKALAIEGITPEQRAQAHVSIGRGYYWGRKKTAAITELEKVIEIKEASPRYKVSAQMFLGYVWNQGNDDLAQKAYAKIMDIPDVSSADKATARMAIAEILIRMKRYADAGAEIQAVLADKDLPPKSRALAQLSLGKVYLLEKNYAAARAEAVKALAMESITDGIKAEARLRIGLSYYAEQDYAHAMPELQKVLTMPGVDTRQIHEAELRLRRKKLIPGSEKDLTVLFIGASHTDQWKVPQIVEALAASAPPGRPRVFTDGFLRGGTGIKQFWEGHYTVRDRIAEELWDFVVFETHPFLSGHDDFVNYATKFANLISSKKAIPVFLENPWVFKESYPSVFQKNHEENVALGKELHVPVAPAGYAWIKYLGPTPTPEQRMALYNTDAMHYSKKGAYLVACAVYAAITGFSPIGLAHDIPHFAPDDITKEEAQAFQEAAWKAYQETHAELKPAP